MSLAEEALAKASFICPIMKEVINPRAQVRSPALADHSLDPLVALDQYLRTRHFSEQRVNELRRYAAKLVAEESSNGLADLTIDQGSRP